MEGFFTQLCTREYAQPNPFDGEKKTVRKV